MSQYDEFCIQNKELCIENKELCIKNKEFCIQMMNFAGRSRSLRLRPRVITTMTTTAADTVEARLAEVGDGDGDGRREGGREVDGGRSDGEREIDFVR